MAPRGCLLLPLVFIVFTGLTSANERVTECGDKPVACTIDVLNLCVGCETPTAVPNPFDCNSYYVCLDYTFLLPELFFCLDGEIFDQTTLECKPDDGTCQPFCKEPDGDGCYYECRGNPGGRIADPFDCSVYRQCDALSPGPAERCPVDAPYFDGVECWRDESACCNCHPYCYDEDDGLNVEDPMDCRKYYLCLEPNKVPVFSTACKDGYHFDPHARQCSNTAPCMTQCVNKVDVNGCIDPYTCQEAGYFPKCNTQCLSDYYHCLEVNDDYAIPEKCPGDLVFNPDSLTCVSVEECPYSRK